MRKTSRPSGNPGLGEHSGCGACAFPVVAGGTFGGAQVGRQYTFTVTDPSEPLGFLAPATQPTVPSLALSNTLTPSDEAANPPDTTISPSPQVTKHHVPVLV